MKFATVSLALLSTALAASSESVSYQYETVTNQHTTEVTITSCADQKCTTSVQALATTVVTATVDGVKTVYTTVCPASNSAHPTLLAPGSVVPVPSQVGSSASDGNITYVDITSTPTVTASTGVQSTVYRQSTFTSVYHNGTSAVPSVAFTNNAPRNLVAGAAGLAGVAALLL